MRHASFRAMQRTERGCDAHRAKSWAQWAHAEDSSEQSVIRMCGPGMGVGSRRLRILRGRGQAELQHRLPGREPFDVAIAESGFTQRFQNVEAEVVGSGRQRCVREHALHHSSLHCSRDCISENREDVRLLTVGAGVGRIAKETAR